MSNHIIKDVAWGVSALLEVIARAKAEYAAKRKESTCECAKTPSPVQSAA